MKKKGVFYTIYLAFLTVISITIVFLYHDGKDTFCLNKYNIEQEMPSYIASAISNLTLQITGDDAAIGDSYWFYDECAILNDVNFYYQVVDSSNGQTLLNSSGKILEDVEKEECLFYLKLSFDETGNINGDYDENERTLVNHIKFHLESDNKLDPPLSKYLHPRNMIFYFVIPKAFYHDTGIIANMVYMNQTISIITLCISSFIIAGLILLTPLTVLNEVIPFKTIRKLKGELNLFLVGFLLTICVSFVPSVSMLSASGGLQTYFLNNGLHISNAVMKGFNVLAWMIFIMVVSLAVYDVKYILMEGVWRFIKEDTLFGWIVSKIIGLYQKITSFDLKEKPQKQLTKMILGHFVMILICCIIPVFGIFLAVAYAVALYIYLHQKLSSVQNDYQTVHQAIDRIGTGDFDKIDMMKFGYFQDLKPSLTKISLGFEKAVQEEIKSQKMKTELISNVSHDLKTPLTGLSNYIELFEEPNLTDENRKEYLSVMKQYLNRLNMLIEDLFEVSKAVSGDISLNLTHLDIMELLWQVKAECQEKMEEKGLEVIIHSTSMHIYLDLDGEKTYRIFENLLNNISKYSLEHTRVYIDVTTVQDKIEIVFKNISKDPLNFDPEEITERFVRGDKSRHTSGSGLGLAIVKSFTEAQKGKFKIFMDGDLFKAQLLFPLSEIQVPCNHEINNEAD